MKQTKQSTPSQLPTILQSPYMLNIPFSLPPNGSSTSNAPKKNAKWFFWLFLGCQVFYFLRQLYPKTSNYCLKNRALGFPGWFFWLQTTSRWWIEIKKSSIQVIIQLIQLIQAWKKPILRSLRFWTITHMGLAIDPIVVKKEKISRNLIFAPSPSFGWNIANMFRTSNQQQVSRHG